jgi:hypothetical protein
MAIYRFLHIYINDLIILNKYIENPPPLVFAAREGVGVAVYVGSQWQMRQTTHLHLRQRGGDSWWQRRQTHCQCLRQQGVGSQWQRR